MIFYIRQRLRRSDNDRIARMNADRINIFHITNRDARICMISHHFIFNFFKACHAPFD